MKKKLVKGILAATGLVLVSGGILVASNTQDKVKDVTPPYGRLEIKGATAVNSVNYVDRTAVTVALHAKDDICADGEIKYYMSTSPISDTEEIEESKWKSYYEGVTEKVDLPSLSSTNTIYVAFKDKSGNTSVIYVGDETKCTVTYNANGGTGAPAQQTTYAGMSVYLTNEVPTYEGKYFLGWSSGENSTEAEYIQGDYLPASLFEGENKNITLYAVWTDKLSELPLLADRVKVGDYVNYPVYYENVATRDGSYTASLTGWRVLSIEDDGTVNLVSAGVPLTYYHYNNAETSIKNLAINFLDVPFSTTTNYTFRKTGFNPYVTLEETFNNKYTATYENATTVSYTSTYNN